MTNEPDKQTMIERARLLCNPDEARHFESLVKLSNQHGGHDGNVKVFYYALIAPPVSEETKAFIEKMLCTNEPAKRWTKQ